MKHSVLVAFLDNAIDAKTFCSEIAAEFAAFKTSLAMHRIRSIILTDGPEVTVTRRQVKRLLEAVAARSLPFDLANYVADALIMSDDFEFEDNGVRDAIYFLSDDSRPPTIEDVKAVMEALSTP